ncbi:HD domain-containing protein [Micromonospora aurantiaca (nom. illeg.)]|uniref:HD domain-containing protein n=1 Tax=Micromonospora aurantiaca (nom. illeg.) TaxID=47850 RepID=UPI0033CBDB8A
MSDLTANAKDLAGSLLDSPKMARRWTHVQGVGRRATELTSTVAPADRDLLVAAAWLHDVGYAPDLVDTGLHSLDGARYLRRNGYPLRLVRQPPFEMSLVGPGRRGAATA